MKKEKTIKTIKSISSLLLANEALKRSISVKHLNPYRNDEAFLELNYKNHSEFIIGQRTSLISFAAYWILENKDLTRQLLKKNGISIPSGAVFNKNNTSEILDYCRNIGFPVVAKPTCGAHGDLVFVGIENKKELDEAIKKILNEYSCVLIEKMFFGEEYRIVATRNKFIAATKREPANVVGDGTHSIGELVEIKNSDLRRGDTYQDIFVKIKIDEVAEKMLLSQKLKLDDILSKGRIVYLRNNSNISTGGDSIDVTDIVHADFKRIAVKIIRSIPELPYGGIDIMSNQDISKKPTKKSYTILEANSSPGISLQHYPFEGKPRNVAKEIIDMLFPETKK
ncbi:MAG: hypothetical protein WA063_04820 [Minisyncoccia bacterium]